MVRKGFVLNVRHQIIVLAHAEFFRTVNMGLGDLRKHLGDPCNRRAKTKFLRQTISLYRKPLFRWGMGDVRISKSHVSFIKRNRKLRRGFPLSGCRFSRRTIALMNRGFDPNK